MGASAATATFQIDVTGCASFNTGGSCAGFKPSSFQATWTYDEKALAAPLGTSTNAQGNTVTGSSLTLSATLSKPYAVTAGQLASVGVPAGAVSDSAKVAMERTTTPSGADVSDPSGAYTARLEQTGSTFSFASGVSTNRTYLSSLSAYAPLPATLSPVSGGSLMSFVDTAPYWSFNSITLVSTFASGVSSTVEVDYYGSARVIASAVPEPEMAGLMLAGLALVGSIARRRANRRG